MSGLCHQICHNERKFNIFFDRACKVCMWKISLDWIVELVFYREEVGLNFLIFSPLLMFLPFSYFSYTPLSALLQVLVSLLEHPAYTAVPPCVCSHSSCSVLTCTLAHLHKGAPLPDSWVPRRTSLPEPLPSDFLLHQLFHFSLVVPTCLLTPCLLSHVLWFSLNLSHFKIKNENPPLALTCSLDAIPPPRAARLLGEVVWVASLCPQRPLLFQPFVMRVCPYSSETVVTWTNHHFSNLFFLI